jgi:hypothetical protein
VGCHDNAQACLAGGGGDATMIRVDCYANGFGPAFNSDPTYRSASCVKFAGIGSTDDLVIRDSFIHDNFWNGAWADYHGGTVVITNTTFQDNVSAGFHYEISGGWNGTDHAVVIGSTFTHNGWGNSDPAGQAGIVVQGSEDVALRRNVFIDNAGGRAVLIGTDARAPWGNVITAVDVRDNVLHNQSVTGCRMEGVTCVDNA